jgi:hypothetical protein
MDFNWYKEISFSTDLTQGDIITDCNIPLPNTSIYDAILENTEEVKAGIEITIANVIVLSQACDIANSKITNIVLCPISPLCFLFKASDYLNGKTGRDNLRQGKEHVGSLEGQGCSQLTGVEN